MSNSSRLRVTLFAALPAVAVGVAAFWLLPAPDAGGQDRAPPPAPAATREEPAPAAAAGVPSCELLLVNFHVAETEFVLAAHSDYYRDRFEAALQRLRAACPKAVPAEWRADARCRVLALVVEAKAEEIAALPRPGLLADLDAAREQLARECA